MPSVSNRVARGEGAQGKVEPDGRARQGQLANRRLVELMPFEATQGRMIEADGGRGGSQAQASRAARGPNLRPGGR